MKLKTMRGGERDVMFRRVFIRKWDVPRKSWTIMLGEAGGEGNRSMETQTGSIYAL